MNTYTRLLILTPILFFMVFSVFASTPEQPGTISVTAKSLIPLPKTLNIQISDVENNDDISQESIGLVASIIASKGVNITEKGSFFLYIQRIRNTNKIQKSKPVSMSFEGGEKGLNSFQLDINKGDATPATKDIRRLPTIYGFEGRLEGPGGLTYWTVKVFSQFTKDMKSIPDQTLLTEGFNIFGQTLEKTIPHD